MRKIQNDSQEDAGVRKLKGRLLLIISLIFIIFTFMLAMPSLVFAGEGETLDFDIAYSEVSAFGSKGTIFEFEVSVMFDGEEEKFFEIVEEFSPGWSMDINPGSSAINIPLLRLNPGAAEVLKIKCRPMVEQEPGEYIFKVILKSAEEGDMLEGSAEFTGIVKPDGKLELFAPTDLPFKDRLNTEVTAGKENIYILILKNTGTAPVEDIKLSSSGEPEGWLVELEDNIDVLSVGEELEVKVTIMPPERTIAGNYNIRFNVSSEDGNDSLELRTMVETPLIWKIIGIGLIALVIAGIAVIFERLGRR
ncbi:MAG: hypothetical protein K8S14_05650 [Actinomycetia bacterium]|nr:hypothetical protein [Actinomycetes bacterium]